MIPVQLYTEMIDKGIDLTNGVLSNADPEKLAKGVNELTGLNPVNSEINAQEDIIKNSVDMSDLEKLERLKDITEQKEAIRDKELARKQQAAVIVDNHIQKVGDLALKCLLAFFSGGWSLAPEIYDRYKNKHHKSDEQGIIDHSLED